MIRCATYWLCDAFSVETELHVSCRGKITSHFRHDAETHSVGVECAHIHCQFVAFQFVWCLYLAHEKGVVNECRSLGQVEYQFLSCHLVGKRILEVQFGCKRKHIAGHYAGFVCDKRGVVSSVIELALVEERNSAKLQSCHQSRLYRHLTLDIVVKRTQSCGSESRQFGDIVEELALTHHDISICAVGNVCHCHVDKLVVALSYEIAVTVIEQSHHLAVLGGHKAGVQLSEFNKRERDAHIVVLIHSTFNSDIVEAAGLALGCNLQHVAYRHLFKQHDVRVLHAELRHVPTLCLVEYGVADVVVVGIMLLHLRLHTLVCTLCEREGSVDCHTCHRLHCHVESAGVRCCKHILCKFQV